MKFFSKHKRILIVLGVCVVIFAILGLIFKAPMDRLLLRIADQRDSLLELVKNNIILSMVFYSLLLYIAAFTPVPIISFIAIIGGMFFGFWNGFIFSCIMGTISAVTAFLMARYKMRTYLKKKYADELNDFYQDLKEDEVIYFISLRVMPILPFAFVNYFSGLTHISALRFTLTTFIGMLLDYGIYTWVGSQFAILNSMDELLTPNYLIIYGAAAVLISYPKTAKWIRKKWKERNQ